MHVSSLPRSLNEYPVSIGIDGPGQMRLQCCWIGYRLFESWQVWDVHTDISPMLFESVFGHFDDDKACCSHGPAYCGSYAHFCLSPQISEDRFPKASSQLWLNHPLDLQHKAVTPSPPFIETATTSVIYSNGFNPAWRSDSYGCVQCNWNDTVLVRELEC
jgi:hypothetical protein